ncbi:MAG TPA: hypothetical protein P5307_03925, partial [Pirellulaceae bacterium]|nr:hypothetical protein [Pirellulaceae bacterium]
MSDTATSDIQAWLAKEVMPFGQYVVRLSGDYTVLGGLDQGHWVVAVDAAGKLNRIGRIMRIRSEYESTTLYLDRLHLLRRGGMLADIGLTLPLGPIARLRPEDLLNVLAWDGVSTEADVSIVQDDVYVRELLELAIRDDLCGPAGGPEELVIDTSVRDRYLVGKLAPRRPGDVDEEQVEPAAAVDDSQVIPDEENEAPLHEPGAEFNRASGRVEPEDDSLDEIDTTNNQSLVPSSMGLTFCVGPDVEEVEVSARWGRYERVPNDEHDYTKPRRNRETGEQEEVKVRVWRRVPCGGTSHLPMADGQIRPQAPDPQEGDVRIQGTVRTNAKGERLVTLFLVNGQLEPETNKDTAWLFQPEIAVRSRNAGSPQIFRRRPGGGAVVDDAERDHLGLIYRRNVEFAVGHGVAVHAEASLDDPTRAVEIRTEVIPRSEVPVTETPGLDPADRPAMREMVEHGWLDMSALAEMEPDELGRVLSTLADDYEAWIGDQRARVGTEVVGYD